jgi:hypothetical protein
MANIQGLKTAIINAFTANLTATERQKLRDRFVAEYQGEWNALVAAGTVDNAANRGLFAVDKLFHYLNDIYRAGSARENQSAVPPPEILG